MIIFVWPLVRIVGSVFGPGDAAGHQRGHHPGNVERGCERRERLAVVGSVLVPLLRRRHPLEDAREEAPQERLHLRGTALD
jgi:hypothetical protein